MIKLRIIPRCTFAAEPKDYNSYQRITEIYSAIFFFNGNLMEQNSS